MSGAEVVGVKDIITDFHVSFWKCVRPNTCNSAIKYNGDQPRILCKRVS